MIAPRRAPAHWRGDSTLPVCNDNARLARDLRHLEWATIFFFAMVGFGSGAAFVLLLVAVGAHR